MDKPYKDSYEALGKALERLEEALNEDIAVNPLAIDGTIQRFEFCIELFWKVLKKKLAEQGIVVKSPKEAFQEAYQLEWIDDQTLWLSMLNDRNESSHTYNDGLAEKIYSQIANYFTKMHEVYKQLT
jgi:nucleotidyltransferase substrate binding protein (TIGR01987 family)